LQEFDLMRLESLIPILALLATSQAGAAEPAAWETEPPPRVIADQFAFELGVVFGGLDTNARVDETPDDPGTPFNAEDDFGLDDTTIAVTPELTLYPGKRNLLRLGGLSVQRHATTTMQTEIVYEGDVFEVGDVVSSSFDINIVNLTYGYQILSRRDYSLALTAGIQVVDVKTNARVRNEMNREPTGDIAPVPVIGIEGQFGFANCCAIEGRVQYSKISTDDIEGSLMDARLGVVWQPNPHLTFGLGYRSFDLEAESFSEDSAGLANFKMTGPLLYARASL
jgi:hypothetical protein